MPAKISLVNMPFASVAIPSLALHQLATRISEVFGDAVRIRVLDLNHDLAVTLGLDLYQAMATSLEANMAGLGDWVFAATAFSGTKDNSRDYFQRFFRESASPIAAEATRIQALRRNAAQFLQNVIGCHGLDQEDAVGCTSMFCQTTASLGLFRALKRGRPSIVTFLGGANCEFPMGAVLTKECEELDFVFSGPALKSFTTWTRRWLSGDTAGLHAIDGVLSKRNAVRRSDDMRPVVRATGAPESIEDVPIPSFDAFVESYGKRFGLDENIVIPFETSRGCWWGEKAHCTFCGLNGQAMAFNSMSPERAIPYINGLFKYAHVSRRFQATDNIMPRHYIRQVMPSLKVPVGVSMFYEVKADLSRQDIEVLSGAGVREIQPGIEALSTDTLKLMRKGTSSLQNVVFLKNCLDFGVEPAWNLLLGFPGEPEQVYHRYLTVVPDLVHLPPPAGAFPIRFDRFSPYFTDAHQFGLRLRPHEWYSYVYPYTEGVLTDLAYFFADAAADDRNARLGQWVSAVGRAVEAWRKRWQSGPPPVVALSRTDEGVHLIDTRAGGGDGRHAVTPRVLACLHRLEVPGRVEALMSDGWEEELEWLRDHRLLFEDGGRAVSLVTGGDVRAVEGRV